MASNIGEWFLISIVARNTYKNNQELLKLRKFKRKYICMECEIIKEDLNCSYEQCCKVCRTCLCDDCERKISDSVCLYCNICFFHICIHCVKEDIKNVNKLHYVYAIEGKHDPDECHEIIKNQLLEAI